MEENTTELLDDSGRKASGIKEEVKNVKEKVLEEGVGNISLGKKPYTIKYEEEVYKIE